MVAGKHTIIPLHTKSAARAIKASGCRYIGRITYHDPIRDSFGVEATELRCIEIPGGPVLRLSEKSLKLLRTAVLVIGTVPADLEHAWKTLPPAPAKPPEPPEYVEEIILLNRAIDACFAALRVSDAMLDPLDMRRAISNFTTARDRALVGIAPDFETLTIARNLAQ